MLNNPGAEALMQDARDAYARAEALMAAGDWRDGAEKGWLAFRAANIALVGAVTGVRNRTSVQINTGFRKLANQRGGEYAELNTLYGRLAQHLHSQGSTTASTTATCRTLCARLPTSFAAPNNWP